MKLFPHLLRVRGHTIWTKQLGADTVVVDAGAHRGEFSRELKEQFGCACYLVEANRVLADDLHGGGFMRVITAALSGTDGKSRFIFRNNPESGSITALETDASVETAEVDTISLATLMQRAGLDHIDLLKLDIEGAEFDLIDETPDSLLASIAQITIEFHDFLPNFRGRDLYVRAKRRLEGMGFVSCRMAFRTHGDVLFLNRRIAGLGTFASRSYSALGRWAMRICRA